MVEVEVLQSLFVALAGCTPKLKRSSRVNRLKILLMERNQQIGFVANFIKQKVRLLVK